MQVGLCENTHQFISNIRTNVNAVIALDMGSNKVGVAKGSITLKISTPLLIIEYNNQAHLAHKLLELINKYEIGGIVVGLPKESLKVNFTKFFEEMNLGLPFIFEDETYTTKLANEMMSNTGLSRKKRNQIDDKISAKLILDSLFAKI